MRRRGIPIMVRLWRGPGTGGRRGAGRGQARRAPRLGLGLADERAAHRTGPSSPWARWTPRARPPRARASRAASPARPGSMAYFAHPGGIPPPVAAAFLRWSAGRGTGWGGAGEARSGARGSPARCSAEGAEARRPSSRRPVGLHHGDPPAVGPRRRYGRQVSAPTATAPWAGPTPLDARRVRPMPSPDARNRA